MQYIGGLQKPTFFNTNIYYGDWVVIHDQIYSILIVSSDCNVILNVCILVLSLVFVFSASALIQGETRSFTTVLPNNQSYSVGQ